MIDRLKGRHLHQKDDWITPPAVYKMLDDIYHFDFDPCPPNPTFDGLAVEWKQRNYVNPPFGAQNHVQNWLNKGISEFQKGKLVVFMLPDRIDPQWFHLFAPFVHSCGFGVPISDETKLWFWKGRIAFIDPKTGEAAKNNALGSIVIALNGLESLKQEVYF